MKRISILLVFILLGCFLFSCSTSDHSRDIKEQLTAPFEYKIKTDEFEFTYKKEADKVTMTVTSPSTLEGLVLEKTPSGITASYDGLVVTLPAAAAAKLFALDTLVDTVIKAIDEKNYTTASKGGQAVLTVAKDDYVYDVYFDTDTGKISSAVVSEGEDKATYNFIQ